MKFVFVSNYFNHHQRPISNELYRLLGEDYYFVETEPMEEERVKLGWSVDEFPSYVVNFDKFEKNKEKYKKLINEADVVMIGSAPESLLCERKASKGLILRYSERIFKKKCNPLKCILRYLKMRRKYSRNDNSYLLCASAYAKQDYEKFGLYKNKAFKWGYFPQAIAYDDIEGLISSKASNSIIWVARFIDWKHPEIAIEVASRLKRDGYDFELNMIGNGVMLDEMKKLVEKLGLNDKVHILGSMKPEEVREYMEKSQIHIFTSDRQEGWGAVLNESMNSACVAIANKEIGSAPYLIDDKNNGFLYETVEELYETVKNLLDDKNKQKEIAKRAYERIISQWNSTIAAERLLLLSQSLLEKKTSDYSAKGICSKA